MTVAGGVMVVEKLQQRKQNGGRNQYWIQIEEETEVSHVFKLPTTVLIYLLVVIMLCHYFRCRSLFLRTASATTTGGVAIYIASLHLWVSTSMVPSGCGLSMQRTLCLLFSPSPKKTYLSAIYR